LKENKFAFRDCECQLKDRLFELREQVQVEGLEVRVEGSR
jgi:hypothetical protein